MKSPLILRADILAFHTTDKTFRRRRFHVFGNGLWRLGKESVTLLGMEQEPASLDGTARALLDTGRTTPAAREKSQAFGFRERRRRDPIGNHPYKLKAASQAVDISDVVSSITHQNLRKQGLFLGLLRSEQE